MKYKPWFVIGCILAVFALLPVLLAQDLTNGILTNGVGTNNTDLPGTPVPGLTPEGIVLLLAPIVATLLTAGVKKIFPLIPKLLIPITSTVFGTLLAWLGTQTVGDGAPFLLSVVFGLGSIGIREIVTQLQKASGVTPDSSARVAGLLLLAILLPACLLSVGCKTTNPTTGEVEFDPVRTDQVKAALKAPVTVAVSQVILRHPENGDAIANYTRIVGGIFCDMRDARQFNPSFLITRLDALTIPQIQDPMLVSLKATVIALYEMFYAQRHTAELSPEEWPYFVSDLFCQAINSGLIDAGKPGVYTPELQSLKGKKK